MNHEVDWNMSGEPEWKDEMSIARGLGIPYTAKEESKSEYWILRRTIDGWRLVSERPANDKVKAADSIRVMSPGTYKILETVASYKSEIELLPLAED